MVLCHSFACIFYHIHVMTLRIHFAIATKNHLTTYRYNEHVWVKLNLSRLSWTEQLQVYNLRPNSKWLAVKISSKLLSQTDRSGLEFNTSSTSYNKTWSSLKHTVQFPRVFFIDRFTGKTKHFQNPPNQGASVKLNCHLILLRVAAKFCVDFAVNAVPLSGKIIRG